MKTRSTSPRDLLFNLEAEGYRTHHEADGDSALAWLLNTPEPPAAVLLDVMLPGQDGFSIVRALRDAGRFIPVLLLTARGRSEDIVEGFSAGADDYLPKPFDLNILMARLAGLLRRVHWAAKTGPAGRSNRTGSRRASAARPPSHSAIARSTSMPSRFAAPATPSNSL